MTIAGKIPADRGLTVRMFTTGLLLVVLYGAFIAEIYRSALDAIPRGQREAGLAVGLHRARVFVHVVLPQATKIAIPNIGSMFIGMVKTTSVFSVIGLLEVIHVTENIEATTFQPFVLYTAAAGIYVAIAFVLDFAFRLFERTLAKPAKGRLSGLVTARTRRRIAHVAARASSATGAPVAGRELPHRAFPSSS